MSNLDATERLVVAIVLALLTGVVPGAVLGYLTSYDRFAGDPSPGMNALALTAIGVLVTLVVVPFVLHSLAYWTRGAGGRAVTMAGFIGVFVLTVILAVAGWVVGYSLTLQW